MNLASDPSRVEWIFAIDDDDSRSVEALSVTPVEHAKTVIVPTKSMFHQAGTVVAAWNMGALRATGDILMAVADDYFPPEGWDDLVEGRMPLDSPAVLFVSDGNNPMRDGFSLQTHGIVNRRRYDDAGFFYFPQYMSMFCDDDFSYCAVQDKVAIEAFDIRFEHRHPSVKGVPMHATTARSNGADRSQYGATLFARRREELKADRAGSHIIRHQTEGVRPLISFLICHLPDRQHLLQRLFNGLLPQLGATAECLVFEDEGALPTGSKRNRLLTLAHGEYIAFIDDDDEVTDDYVESLSRAIHSSAERPDCCSLRVDCLVDGRPIGVADHSMAYRDWHQRGNRYFRCPNHLNVVKRHLANVVRFPDVHQGEDRGYSFRLRPLLTSEAKSAAKYFYRKLSSQPTTKLNEAQPPVGLTYFPNLDSDHSSCRDWDAPPSGSGSGDLERLGQQLLARPDCVAVNTNGVFKRRLRPTGEWNTWGATAREGLLVKVSAININEQPPVPLPPGEPQFFERVATHLPALLRAIALTAGPVLEIGCGMYSTYCLHGACAGRRLVSLETDRAWYDRFTPLRSETHELYHAGSYEDFDMLIRSQTWDVVLIDHRPADRRKVECGRVLDARFVVLHDTEDDCYGWSEVLSQFKFQWTDRRLLPWTTVVSNREPVGTFA